MKFAVAVILALAMAVNARQLTWSPEQMAAMGYPMDNPTVSPEFTDPLSYGNPWFVKPVEEDPAKTAPTYYGKYYPIPVAGDDSVIDPYHGYYVKPTVDDTATDPVACYYKKHFSCAAPEEVSPACGTETCTYPNLCLTVTKTIKKMIEVPVTECADPKLVCKEITKECGDTSCAYNEVCKVDKVCKKVYGYPYPGDDVDDAATPPAPYLPYPYPYPYPYPDVGGEDNGDKKVSSATAKAIATSTGDGPATANAVAKAGGKSLLTYHPKYPAKDPAVDPAAVDPAYALPYKVICKDVYSCEEVDPKVCKTITHEVCVKKDPKTYAPGFFKGYSLDWAKGYQYGQPCGGSVCAPGSFCATCDVEVCKDAVMEKDAAQCGYDAKGVPTFCPAGHMCTELCAPVKKYIAVEVPVSVCVDPTDETYAEEIKAAATKCGPHLCLPGYECNTAPVKVCGAYEDPAEVDDDSMDGYYFYYDPKATADDADKMPGYHFYPHSATGDASGCGFYLFHQDDIVVDDAVEPAAMDPYYYHPYYAPVDTKPTVDDSASLPYYYGLGGYPYVPQTDPAAEEPYYYKPVEPWAAKPVEPWAAKPVEPWAAKPMEPWAAKPAEPWVDTKPAETWVPPVIPQEKPGTVKAVAKSTGDNVYVWGSSDTTGDASGHFNAYASIGDDTHAEVTGNSGPGDDHKGHADVYCDTASADGKVAGCDGTATHNN